MNVIPETAAATITAIDSKKTQHTGAHFPASGPLGSKIARRIKQIIEVALADWHVHPIVPSHGSIERGRSSQCHDRPAGLRMWVKEACMCCRHEAGDAS